jgi:hypothetical protein
MSENFKPMTMAPWLQQAFDDYAKEHNITWPKGINDTVIKAAPRVIDWWMTEQARIKMATAKPGDLV